MARRFQRKAAGRCKRLGGVCQKERGCFLLLVERLAEEEEASERRGIHGSESGAVLRDILEGSFSLVEEATDRVR